MPSSIKLNDLPLDMQKRLLRLPDGPGGVFDVTIPDWRPLPLNKLLALHYMRQSAEKRKCYETIAAALSKAGVTAATGKRHVSFVAIYGKGERRLDHDAFWKVLLDGLEFCGAIKRDSPAWCDLGEPGTDRAERPAFRIVLEDVAGA